MAKNENWADDYLVHKWKYIDKFKTKNGKWRYIYPNDIVKGIANKANQVYGKINKTYNKIFKDNIYAINSSNRKDKIAKVWQTKEWQDIVRRKDPEYVKQNKDGSYTYDIDSYILNKKHPILDMLNDVINGRNISVNNVDMSTFVASANDYIEAGLAYIGLRSTILTTAMKVRQGTYDDKLDDAKKVFDTGIKVANQTTNNTNEYMNKLVSSPEIQNAKAELEKKLKNLK